MTSLKSIVYQYQIALFPEDYYFSDTKETFLKLKTTLKDCFDGNNQYIPLPVSEDVSLPRIILLSNKYLLQCNISFSKIDLIWYKPKDSQNEFKLTYDHINDILARIAKNTYQNKNIQRVGYIKDYYIEIEKDKENILYSNLLNKNYFQNNKDYNLENVDIQLTYKRKIEDHIYNNVFTLKEGEKHINSKYKIFIKSDFNTLQTDKLEWSSNEVLNFIIEAEKRTKTEDLNNLLLPAHGSK